MSFAMTQGVALQGIDGELVSIEADVTKGLPSYQLLGLPDAALNESRDRIRSAIQNSHLNWPQHKITVSLSPAWLPKSGSGFDLPISIAILAASGQIPINALAEVILIGELSLEGNLKPIRGILPMLLAATKHGSKRAILPVENAIEGSLVGDLEIMPAQNLLQVIGYLNGSTRPTPIPYREVVEKSNHLDISQVAGQKTAKFGLEVAATGGHHLLMIGPPGTGKTMLAERLPTILPRLSSLQARQVAAIHSVAGTFDLSYVIERRPPFIAPHHSTTTVAMVGGGGKIIRPGACSLAQSNVLSVS